MRVFLLVGSPGSGKTWVMGQLKNKFHVIEHDDYRNAEPYIRALIQQASVAGKPILANTPFGVSDIMNNLAANRVKCTPVFIIERPDVLAGRYMERENKVIPQGHITRQNTYIARAKELGAFSGTSSEVLSYLKSQG